MFRFFIGGPSYVTQFLAQAGLNEKTKKDKSWPPTETAVIQAENKSRMAVVLALRVPSRPILYGGANLLGR